MARLGLGLIGAEVSTTTNVVVSVDTGGWVVIWDLALNEINFRFKVLRNSWVLMVLMDWFLCKRMLLTIASGHWHICAHATKILFWNASRRRQTRLNAR